MIIKKKQHGMYREIRIDGRTISMENKAKDITTRTSITLTKNEINILTNTLNNKEHYNKTITKGA